MITFMLINKDFRLKYLTTPLLKIFQAKIPPMSLTEQQAIAAGDSGWEKELFCGAPDWAKLHHVAKPTLTEKEKNFLSNQVPQLCALINDWETLYSLKDLSKEVWDFIKREKFFGIIIAEEFGGLGFSAYAHSCVITMIASRSNTAATSVMVPNSLGPAEFIQHYGTQQQKQQYLPLLANGREIPCFALTSPTAGSDATSITDTGIVTRHEGTLGLRLNWNKRYITLAPIATLIGLAIHVYDPEHLLGETEDIGITMVFVAANTPGIAIGKRHLPLHQAFMNGPIVGKDVFIPLENVIGGPEKLGQGWQMMTNCLAVGRGISLPAVSTAAAKLCYRMTSAYARVREQFGISIGKFEGVASALARIGAGAYTADAARCFITSTIDSGIKPSVASAITKYHLTELARRITCDAMDVHGGRGIMMGADNYLANLHLATPISITVEGANILTRNLIIFGQGAFRCHPYLADELQAASDNNLEQFDKLIWAHIRYTLANFARAFGYGISAGKWIKTPVTDFTQRYYQQITRMSCALALAIDCAFLVLGGSLKRRENLSARLGDVLSELYLATSVLKYYNDQDKPEADEPFVRYAVEKCLYDAQIALVAFLDNLPARALSWLIKRVIFVWGPNLRAPSDALAMQIANASMALTEQRERLSQYCYIGEGATGQMEQAFQASVNASGAYEKLQKAMKVEKIADIDTALKMGVINQDEFEQLKAFQTLQQAAIQVAAFGDIRK